MIVRDKTNLKIEKIKSKFGLSGDVYLIDSYIESLASHKKLIPESKAETIEQAEYERRIILKSK